MKNEWNSREGLDKDMFLKALFMRYIKCSLEVAALPPGPVCKEQEKKNSEKMSLLEQSAYDLHIYFQQQYPVVALENIKEDVIGCILAEKGFDWFESYQPE